MCPSDIELPWILFWALRDGFFRGHIVLTIALSQTDGPKVCISISDWIRA